MKAAISILCTGEPGEGARELAAKHGVDLDIIPFTNIQFRDSHELRNRVVALAGEDVIVVVTSRNGLKGLLRLLPEIKGMWSIFSLGDYSEEVEIHQDRVNSIDIVWAKVPSADELADVVIRENVKKVVFFCGDQRMDILPRKLAGAGIEVEELVVYDTVPTPIKLARTYDGVLFYSPAVVRSFFEVNSLLPATVAFAIGRSTASELANSDVKNVFVAENPGKIKLLQDSIDYLSK